MGRMNVGINNCVKTEMNLKSQSGGSEGGGEVVGVDRGTWGLKGGWHERGDGAANVTLVQRGIEAKGPRGYLGNCVVF